MRSYLMEAVAQELPAAESVTIDRQHYYRQFLHGYYQFNCVVSKEQGIVRSAKFYIPEGSIYNQPTIIIAIPENSNPWEFMVRSGWKSLADEYGLYLVLMEPKEDGDWGNVEEESEYFNALSNDLSLRPMFCAFQANFYGVGYGKAADLMGYQARRKPRAYAAVALLGTEGMSAEEKETLESQGSAVPGVTLSEVQEPIWLVYENADAATERQLSYYLRANHSCAEAKTENGTSVYAPQAGGTMDEHWCAGVITEQSAWENCVDRAYSERILTELFDGIYRYPGNGNGALRKAENIYDRGFEKFSAPVWGGFEEDRTDMYRREWYVYVPEKAKRKKNVPAVFVFHGAGGSGDEIADRIGWSSVAEQHGLIIIMPTASEPNEVREISDMKTNNVFRAMWNTGAAQKDRPADMLFVDYLYDWLTTHYAVDKSRIYASGQSSGGAMSWSCAAYRPDYFAAVAPFSARRCDLEAWQRGEPDPAYRTGSLIPIFANLGCCDSAFKGGFAAPETGAFIDHWCEAGKLTKRWSDYSYMDGGQNCSYREGLLTHYVFTTEAGVPLLHLSETDTKAHATWPSECELTWSEYFVNFSKDPETKALYYKGERVRTD